MSRISTNDPFVATSCKALGTKAQDAKPEEPPSRRPSARLKQDTSHAPRRGTGLRLLLIAGLATGCPSPTHLPSPGTAELPRPIPPTWTYEPPKGMELIADGMGNVVRVAVVNHTERDVVIGPKMFALIVEGKLHRIDSASATIRFPVRKLRPHEQVLGTFQFHGWKSVEGARLVLYSPDLGAQYVEIKSLTPRAPNYTPDLPPLTKRELRRIKREQEKLRKTLLPELQKLQPQQPRPAGGK